MTRPVCVVSVPAAHPYVAAVLDHEELTVLPDPLPPGAPVGQWWPPVALDPEWIVRHADRAQLLHIHFGTESFSSQHLAEVVDAAHSVGWPVVQTVHDLVHPQLTDQSAYREQLDVLVPRADEVITLTEGSAQEIARRWGRTARVLPHPRLLSNTETPPIGLVRSEPLVGMHLKDLRPNVDGVGATRVLLRAITRLRDQGVAVSAEIRMHHRVRDEAQRDAIRRLCQRREDVVLLEHERLDDAGLAHSLAHLDVCVLPYRFGTHSGWLELCWDLGVSVAAPSTGYYVEQHVDDTVASFDFDEDGHSLLACLARLLVVGTPTGSAERLREVGARLADRDAVDRATADEHLHLYRQLLSESRVP